MISQSSRCPHVQLKTQNTLKELKKITSCSTTLDNQNSFPSCPCQPLLINTDTSIIFRTGITFIFEYVKSIYKTICRWKILRTIKYEFIIIMDFFFPWKSTGEFHLSQYRN